MKAKLYEKCPKKSATKQQIGRTYAIDKEVKDAAKVTNDSAGCEEETIGHDLQAHLQTHPNHKRVFSNLHQHNGSHVMSSLWVGFVSPSARHLWRCSY